MTPKELMQPRYKVIADYPEIGRHNLREGDIITRSESAMYGDKTEDGNPVVAIDHDIFPANFRKLEWWEDRKAEDMPEYVRIVDENIIVKTTGEIVPNVGFNYRQIGYEYERRRVFSKNTLPATEYEYIKSLLP